MNARVDALVMIFRTNLLYSLEKLANACIGESPESASKDDCFWNPIKVLTTVEGSYRYNLVAKVTKVVNLLRLCCPQYQPHTKQRHERFLRGSSVGYIHGRIEEFFTLREIQDFTREFQTNRLTAQSRCVYLSHSLLLSLCCSHLTPPSLSCRRSLAPSRRRSLHCSIYALSFFFLSTLKC